MRINFFITNRSQHPSRAQHWIATLLAPLIMILGAYLSALVGLLVLFEGGGFLQAIRIDDWPLSLGMVPYIIYLLTPLPMAFAIMTFTSTKLLQAQQVERPGLWHHLWYCAPFYMVFLWVLRLWILCPGENDSGPSPSQCADPFGTSLVSGLVSLGAILANGAAIIRKRRTGAAAR